MEIKNNGLVIKEFNPKINQLKKEYQLSQKFITQTKIILSDNNINEKVCNNKPCSIADFQKLFLKAEDAYSLNIQQSPQISNEKMNEYKLEEPFKKINASNNQQKEDKTENIEITLNQSKEVIEEDEENDDDYEDDYDEEGQKGYNNLNPFPEISFKQENLIKAISQTQFDKNYDLYLIIEHIILEASGIITCSRNIFNPSRGESLQVYSHELNSLQAYRKDKNQYLSLMNIFNMSYSPIGLTKNNPLPKWLNHQIINGIMHLWGVPKINDDPEILIKVISQNQITIRSSHLVIQDETGNDLRDKNYLKKAHVMMTEAKQKKRNMTKINSIHNIQSKINQITSHSIIKDYQLNVQNQKATDKQDKEKIKQQAKQISFQNDDKLQQSEQLECSLGLANDINSNRGINQKNSVEYQIQDQINKDIDEKVKVKKLKFPYLIKNTFLQKQIDLENQLKVYQNLFRIGGQKKHF
ncbi:hypothetical protein ABPG72_000227 [Tetrahymena utriculariae]